MAELDYQLLASVHGLIQQVLSNPVTHAFRKRHHRPLVAANVSEQRAVVKAQNHNVLGCDSRDPDAVFLHFSVKFTQEVSFMTVIDTEKAKEILDSGMEQANELLDHPEQLQALLIQVTDKMKTVPVLGTVVSELPAMVSLVKSYVTKEYPDVSPKVIAAAVSGFIYLIKKKDLIPDNIPVLGQLDDIAVIALALSLIKPELDAYRSWQENHPETTA